MATTENLFIGHASGPKPNGPNFCKRNARRTEVLEFAKALSRYQTLAAVRPAVAVRLGGGEARAVAEPEQRPAARLLAVFMAGQSEARRGNYQRGAELAQQLATPREDPLDRGVASLCEARLHGLCALAIDRSLKEDDSSPALIAQQNDHLRQAVEAIRACQQVLPGHWERFACDPDLALVWDHPIYQALLQGERTRFTAASRIIRCFAVSWRRPRRSR